MARNYYTSGGAQEFYNAGDMSFMSFQEMNVDKIKAKPKKQTQPTQLTRAIEATRTEKESAARRRARRMGRMLLSNQRFQAQQTQDTLGA